VRFLLDGSVQSLAGDIEAKPSGNFARAGNYDASKDGTYNGSPIPTEYTGTFEGLGNTISNLTIVSGAGLFYEATRTLRDVHLVNVAVTGTATDEIPTGALVGWGLGSVEGATSSGKVTNDNVSNTFPVGGLVGDGNNVDYCSSTATVESRYARWTGGLVGIVEAISNSSASGSVTSVASVVGVVGESTGPISNSLATGTVKSSQGRPAGGLVGIASTGDITNVYATGNVVGGDDEDVGA
jgi:hypothetical protein